MKAILIDSDTPNDVKANVKVYKDNQCIGAYWEQEVTEVIPVHFLENCDIAHKTIAELMGDYNLETMYGGDIVNWILEEYREKYESNTCD